jgi:uncharacterized membrane protein YdjX (TVP38/TMEM64 family)
LNTSHPAVAAPSARWKWVAGLALIAALVAAWLLLPVRDWAESFQGWIEGLGAWGILIFGVVYVVATVLLVPVSVLTLVAGLAFGLAVGFPLVVAAATVGATLAFLVARYLVHQHVERWIEKRPKFRAVKAAVSEGGWKVVGLLRLSPVVPFNVQNYFYGITDVKLSHYVPPRSSASCRARCSTCTWVRPARLQSPAAAGGAAMGVLRARPRGDARRRHLRAKKAQAKLQEHGLRDAESAAGSAP